MMSSIAEFASKHRVYGFFIRSSAFVGLCFISWFQTLNGILRSKFRIKSEQSKIRKLKDKYVGERCFIICTGPSLTVSDLELLKGEYTFSMNSISLLFDKTDFRPTFFGCTDVAVFNKLKENIFKYDQSDRLVFISGRVRRHVKNKLPKHWFNVSCNVAYHTYDRYFRKKFWCKFSDDALFGTYDMYSVTHFLIQIAVYMGFKKIYLIGADCNQSVGGRIHFAEYGVVDKTLDSSKTRNICGYKQVREASNKSDFKVYNATRGGELEVFERVSLENILN